MHRPTLSPSSQEAAPAQLGSEKTSKPFHQPVGLPPLRTHKAVRTIGPMTGDTTTQRSTVSTVYPPPGTDRTIASTSTTGGDPRRGHRKPVKQFQGVPHSEPNSHLPPAVSALPDLSNWRTPALKQRTVAAAMNQSSLDDRNRFDSPFKCAGLQQPEPLRCTPVPNGSSNLREDILDKPTLLAAAIKSLPTNVSPLLQNRKGGTKALTVSEMVRVLNDVSRLGGDPNHRSPAYQAEVDRIRSDPMVLSTYSSDQIGDFESSVSEKMAFGKFVSGNKRKRLPAMVLRHFRHQLTHASPLVESIRKLPLHAIEAELEALGPRTINTVQWIGLLVRLVGDTFSRLDAQTLFSFFDTDTDGDIDQRELANGFVFVRSADGPLVAVLHRCKTFLLQNIKDTRLTFMTRFELVLMAEAIAKAAQDQLPTSEERAALQAELDVLLNSFGTNRRGEFPFDDVRMCVLRSPVICKAINSFTVPREPELYNSPLSIYMRSGEPDEGDQPFRLMMSLKLLEKNLRSAAQASSTTNGGGGGGAGSLSASAGVLAPAALSGFNTFSFERRDLDDVELDSEDSDYEDMKRNLDLIHEADPNFRPPEIATPVAKANSAMDTSMRKSTLLSFRRGTTRASVVSDLLSVAAAEANRRRSTLATPSAAMSDTMSASPGDDCGEVDALDASVAHRPVHEPDEPEYYTLRGTLYRKLAGQSAQPYWVSGMPTNIKYSERRV